MFDIQATERCIALILQKAYLEDPAVRHEPLYLDLDRLHQQIRQDVDAAQDAAWAAAAWAKVKP